MGYGLAAIVPNYPKAVRSLIYETAPKYYLALGKKHSPWSTATERTNRNRADLIYANGRGSNGWFPRAP